jgi:hypothetical protein
MQDDKPVAYTPVETPNKTEVPVSQQPASSSQPEGPAAAPNQESAAADAVPAQQEYAGAPASVCELNRIKHLHELNILYTPPEQRFDDVTRLCTLVFKVRDRHIQGLHECTCSVLETKADT